jgi:hypothetical protein
MGGSNVFDVLTIFLIFQKNAFFSKIAISQPKLIQNTFWMLESE